MVLDFVNPTSLDKIFNINCNLETFSLLLRYYIENTAVFGMNHNCDINRIVGVMVSGLASSLGPFNQRLIKWICAASALMNINNWLAWLGIRIISSSGATCLSVVSVSWALYISN